jgi:hypothetical protein
VRSSVSDTTEAIDSMILTSECDMRVKVEDFAR